MLVNGVDVCPRDCPDRNPDCHADCEIYLEYHRQQKVKYEENVKDLWFNSFRADAVKRTKRGR